MKYSSIVSHIKPENVFIVLTFISNKSYSKYVSVRVSAKKIDIGKLLFEKL